MKYLKMPYIPAGKVKLVMVDSRITNNIKNIIRAKGIDFIEVPYCKDLYQAISSHPDIFMYPSNKGLIVAPNLYDSISKELLDYNINIIKGDTVLTSTYPHDIAYNVCRIGKYAIHNFKYTDRAVLKSIELDGLVKIHVKQGYSKCSICVVNENAIITSDKGIARETVSRGIDTLLISDEGIKLSGMSHGFIGGATGLISKDEMLFCGDITMHKDYQSIYEFLSKHNVKATFLEDDDIYDYGSIIPILEC